MTQQGPWSGWDDTSTSQFSRPPQGPPGPGWGGPASQRQGLSGGMVALIVVLAVLVTGLLGAVVYFAFGGDSSGESAAPVTSTVVATAQQGQSGQTQGGPAVAPAPPAPAQRPAAPSGSSQCTDLGAGRYARSAVGSSVTSCDFAGSVQSTYLSQGNSGGSAVIVAYSPVTGTSYTMSCSGGTVVTCTGGNNAVVYLY